MKQKHIRRDGIDIVYEIGHGRGIPLVFLHGGGGSLSSWEMLLPFIKDKRPIVTIDLRGHGLSTRPEQTREYELAEHANDIQAVIESEKIGSVVMIGHCLGGMVAVEFAQRHPKYLNKLVLINTGVTVPPIINIGPLFTLTRFFAKIVSSVAKTGKGLRRVDYHPYVGTGDIHLRRLFEDVSVMGVGSAAKQSLAALNWFSKTHTDTISTQTLVLVGKYDTIFPDSITESLRRLLINSNYRLVPSNHISVINHPQIVAKHIEEFIRA